MHRSRYEEFVERLEGAARELRVGDPTSESTQLGPKVSEPELVKVQRLVDEAVRQGAQLALGGGPPEAPPPPRRSRRAPVPRAAYPRAV